MIAVMEIQIVGNKGLRLNGARAAASIPTANDNAIPEMSLSSVIKMLIFAKIAIIFVTLRGLTYILKL